MISLLLSFKRYTEIHRFRPKKPPRLSIVFFLDNLQHVTLGYFCTAPVLPSLSSLLHRPLVDRKGQLIWKSLLHLPTKRFCAIADFSALPLLFLSISTEKLV